MTSASPKGLVRVCSIGQKLRTGPVSTSGGYWSWLRAEETRSLIAFPSANWLSGALRRFPRKADRTMITPGTLHYVPKVVTTVFFLPIFPCEVLWLIGFLHLRHPLVRSGWGHGVSFLRF